MDSKINNYTSCGKEIIQTNPQYQKRFCDRFCAAKWIATHRKPFNPNLNRRTKIIKCTVCGKNIICNISISPKKCKCKKCQNNNILKNNNLCKYCGKSIISSNLKNIFCSRSCAAKYNNLHRKYRISQDKRIKILKCTSCGKEVEMRINASPSQCKCSDCKKRICIVRKDGTIYHKKNPNIPCKQCGQTPCQRPDICKHYRIFYSISKYLGFNLQYIGTRKIYEEFDRCKNILVEEYLDKKSSSVDLERKYNCCSNAVLNMLKTFDIKRRTISESLINAVKSGKYILPACNFSYKSGHHTTWNGKDIFYRSSYELDYAKELDEQKVDYEVEKLRIFYWDSQLNRQRVAIPDFYLPDTNTIVEIKSTYTLDKQNMVDKKKAYSVHGYKFKLICNHKEIAL